MRVQYAPGLEVDWSEKELRKIAEVKARHDVKGKTGFKAVPWDDEKIRHYKGIRAMCLLDECGISTKEIAAIFDCDEHKVINLINHNREWG